MTGFGQDLQGDFGDHPQATETAGQQAREIVAGDVFHHLAAETQQRAVATDQACAQDKVAYRTGPWATRPRQPGGDHAADRGVVAKCWRFAGQPLPGGVEGGKQFPQRGAGPGRDDQFGGVVVDDATMHAGVQHFAGHFAPQEGLAV
ncbi:hypothetical protein D3C76_1101740 [compost metagenome]